MGKEGASSGEKNARMEAGESVFNRRNVQNTTLRSMADRGNLGYGSLGIREEKLLTLGLVGTALLQLFSDMNDVDLNIRTCEKSPKRHQQ